MTFVLDLARYASGAIFALLGLIGLWDFFRIPDRRRAYIALALSTLGIVALLGGFNQLIGDRIPYVEQITLVAFQLSGLSLLLFRDAFMPTPRWVLTAAVAAVSVSSTWAVLTLEPARTVQLHGTQLAAAIFVIVTWSLCVGEPAFRFLWASRGRPAVQRKRMRAISAGYIGIIIVLVIALIGSVWQPRSQTLQLAIQVLAILMAPLLYIGFAPPKFFRRAWREAEEEQFRPATRELLLFSPSRKVLAERGLEWGVRLVGGDSGALLDVDGSALALQDMTLEEANETVRGLAEGDRRSGRKRRIRRESNAVIPLSLDQGTGYLLVRAGQFTPYFGEEEQLRLVAYASSIVAALDRARVSERMLALEEVKTTFLKLASHELRGPLALIRGYVSMLNEGSIPAEKIPEVTAVMQERIGRMAQMIDEMLETARLEDNAVQLNIDRFDVREVVNQTVDTFRPVAEPSHQIQVHAPTRETRVFADRAKVETIIGNLLDNAIKYSPEGGQIECDVIQSNGRVNVVVQDHGLGIPADQAATLFTRFGRVVTDETRAIAGTGLGLYLSRELARMQDGDLTFSSEAGKGSKFTLSLPSRASA